VRTVGVVAGLVVLGGAASAAGQVAPPAPQAISFGDWQLGPVVEVRARGEYRHDLDAQDRGVFIERTRLGIDVQRSELGARVVFQDVRAWDAAAGSGLSSTTAYEAWGEARTFASSVRPMFVRVGRQPVSWGEGRLLGIADWSPAGRSLDAVRGRLPVGDGAFELLAVSLSVPSGVALTGYGELFGARGEWAYHPLFAVEAYALARLVQARATAAAAVPDDSARGQTVTGALRLHGDAYDWTWGAEGAYQVGHVDALDQARAAFAAAGHVAHTFERVLLLPTLRLGASYASGDDGGSTYRAFDPLLPDVHTWHGAMDLFAWSNEAEASAHLAVTPWPDAVASVSYRYARLAQAGGAWRSAYLVEIGHARNNVHADLGHEVDASLLWSPWGPVELTAGYSVLALGEGARVLLAANPSVAAPPRVSHFAYAQATLRIP
jgi:Alginate export